MDLAGKSLNRTYLCMMLETFREMNNTPSTEIGKPLTEASEVIVTKRRGDWGKVTSVDQRPLWINVDG